MDLRLSCHEWMSTLFALANVGLTVFCRANGGLSSFSALTYLRLSSFFTLITSKGSSLCRWNSPRATNYGFDKRLYSRLLKARLRLQLNRVPTLHSASIEWKSVKLSQKVLYVLGGSGRHRFRPFLYKHFGQFAPLGGEQAAAELPGDWVSIGHSTQWLWYSVYA
ncbi:hypothetical protein KI387_018582, partial [Taxus chinensis]